MKKIKYFQMRFFIILNLLVFSLAFAQKKVNVAVMDLKTAGSLKSASGILSDRLRSELFNTGKFSVMERGEMNSVLKEQGFQASGACDDKACMVEMGQLLGVEKIIAGSIGQLGTLFLINLRIIKVRTGKLIDTYSGECRCPIEELGGAMKKAARFLAGERVEDAKEAAKPVPKAPPAAPKPIKPVKPVTPKVQPAVKKEKKSLSGISLSFSLRGIDPEFNEILTRDAGFIPEGDGAEFSSMKNLAGDLIIGLSPYVSLKFGAGMSWTGADGKYDLDPNVFSFLDTTGISADANVDVNAFTIDLPFRLGVLLHTRPSTLRLRMGFDFMYVLSFFNFDMEGEISAWDSWGNPLTNSFYADMFLTAGGVGFECLLGGELLLGNHFGLCTELTYTRLTFSTFSGTGDLGDLDTSSTDYYSSTSYKFVKVNDYYEGSYYDFMEEDEMNNVPADVKEAEVNFSGIGLRLYITLYL